jgi:ABC-2 type transport system permease protein
MVMKKTGMRDIVELLLSFLIVLILAWLGSVFFFRIDLTSEKRHTLTENTVKFMKELDDLIYVKVYLQGDYPAIFKKLENATREKLHEMRAYSGGNLEFEFINPSDFPDEKTRNENYQKLVDEGLSYTAVQIREKDGVSEKIIFPSALVTHRGKTMPLHLLKSQERMPDAQMVNNSINNLEYELMNIFYQLRAVQQPKIAFLQGNGELDELETGDLAKSLGEFYQVEYVRIDSQINTLSRIVGDGNYRENNFDALVVAKPQKPVNDKDKYIIDQFIMRGGKVIWLIDAMQADMDSLKGRDMTMGVSLNVNLDDLLFNYGVRINKNLLIDRSCAPIGIMTGPMGNQQKMEFFPWYFRPLIIPQSSHPIVSNLDPILTEFVSNLDTLARKGVHQTILLHTSPYTRIFKSPVRISLNIVRIDTDFGNNNSPNQPVAVLMEGTFRSAFENRLSPLLISNKDFGFIPESKPTRMLVVADGDVARNEVNRSRGQFYELGFDRYAGRKIYSNKDFLVNALNYMLGDASLISLRSRTVTLRQLDAERISSERLRWQIVNVVIPVILVLLFGLIQFAIRRRKYAQN